MTVRRSPGRVAAVALVVFVLLGASCTSDRDTSETSDEEETRDSTDEEASAGGGAMDADFGSLTDVCQDGDASGATAQGVTDDAIQVGTLTDFGFTQSREFIDAAEVFTEWCNGNGGVNGRELTFEVRDTNLFEYRQQILQACESDFFLVGGGAAFDGAGVEDRLECELPEIPAQVVSPLNKGSGLQIKPVPDNPAIAAYEDYFRWLVTEEYPDTADNIGIIAGDIEVTQLFAQREQETMESLGAEVVYSDLYPPAGLSDWTPYAQAVKDAGVEGLVFLGNSTDLPKLEQALQTVGAEVVWIDANTNAYNADFIELAAPTLDTYANYSAPLVIPTELADQNPPTQELIDVVAEVNPDATITGPFIQAWSAWMLFATSARDCGSDVTRRCVYDAAVANTEWDGGGLHAASDLSDPDPRRVCFTVVHATPDGFEVPDFGANSNDGMVRCAEVELELTGDYPQAVQLEDVGLTLDDIE